MLDAACAGHVFTSPVPDQMEAATRAVDGGAGVLHIVKNYTGDVLNFQMAAELVAGEVEVATVVTNDDVAVQDSLYTAGRRGVGGTVLVEKIAGAHAEAGGSLADVTATAVKVNAKARSMGMALTSCIVPAAARRRSTCPTTRSRSASASTASRAGAARSWRRSTTSPEWLVDADRLATSASSAASTVLAFVNGMGGTPLIELYVAFNSVAKVLDGAGIVDRPFARRQLHHQPGDGRVLGHAPAAGRRADRAVGRSRPHRRAALGRLTPSSIPAAAAPVSLRRGGRLTH